MSKILVVDDEANVLAAFEELVATEGHDVFTARNAEEAMARIATDRPDLVIMDIRMPGMDGLEAFQRIKKLDAKLPVIIMTGQGTTESAIEATKLGAFDYHLKPFEPGDMLRDIERALESVRLMRRHVRLDAESVPPTSDVIIGHSGAMQQVYKSIGRVAETDATVLIRGESGTGKELVARAIYQHSRRGAAQLVVVNCVAIPESLLESELFGHERGAFTGASARRIGKFEQADGGTIFLDEIGDIPQAIQAKILRVLQERSFERVGGNETISVDVRVLAATNRNLEQAIADAKYREDLYHRLNVVTIQLPPLRERPEDIPKLTDYFLERFSAELTIDKPPLSEEALDVLRSHSWPGNVREVQHCIHRMMIFTRGFPIQASDVRQALENSPESKPADVDSPLDDLLRDLVERYLAQHSGPAPHARFLEQADKFLVAEALRLGKGNQTHAAKVLGLPRPTLHAKLQKYGMRRESDEHDV